jgi:hypothetical protein
MPGFYTPHIRRVYPQLFSNVTVGVQPISQPGRNCFRSKVFV